MTFLASAAAWLTNSKYGPWVLLALGLLTGGLIYRSRLIQQGKEDARRQANEEAQERRERTDAIDREVDAMGDDELDKEGEPWVRR